MAIGIKNPNAATLHPGDYIYFKVDWEGMLEVIGEPVPDHGGSDIKHHVKCRWILVNYDGGDRGYPKLGNPADAIPGVAANIGRQGQQATG